MRCPNCKLLTSDRKDSCPKCGMDLRARKQELGITANEESVTANFSKPPVITPVKTKEHFSAVSAIASATLQIDNAIQEVSKKSASNQASRGGLPIVMDDAIDFDPEFDSDISSDNLLFEQPVEALQISDDELDVLLSTTAQSQLTSAKPALSKKDLLSSLLTQAAQRPAIKAQPKTAQVLSAEPATASASPTPPVLAASTTTHSAPELSSTLAESTQPSEELLYVVPPPPNSLATDASEDDFEFELNLEPESESFEDMPTARVSQIEAWEVETSPEVIEKFKTITAHFNLTEYEALLQTIEDLTGFNLPDMYPEILERSPESSKEPLPHTAAEPPQPIEAEIESAILPDLPTLWAEALAADQMQTADSNEVSALDLLAEPDPRFINPLFERLVERNEFDPDAPKAIASTAITRKHVENSELQSALKKFVEEEESSESITRPVAETWSEEIPTEFGNSNDNRTALLLSLAFGIFAGLGILFFSQSEDTFSSANLVFAIFSTGTSPLLTYAGASVLCRIIFWASLGYPVVRIIRERVFAGRR